MTDNERILGLGDQGAGGMGIPVGKLAIYVSAAGVHPAVTLPISLDVGTDNQELLDDPLYVGYRAPRLRDAAYDEFVERFVEAMAGTFPRAVVQWEDFKGPNAHRLLARYRHRLPSFNDDIQGTGATVLAGVQAASRIMGMPLGRPARSSSSAPELPELGSGGCWRHALAADGVDARTAVLLLDQGGIVHRGRHDLSREKAECAVEPAAVPTALLAAEGDVQLADVIDAWRPQVLIGTTAVQGRFDEATIRALGRVTARPVVLAAVEPDQRLRGHAGRGVRLDRWAGHRRHRQPVRSSRSRRPAFEPSARAITPSSSPAWASARSSRRPGR